jgi:uncharacterized LabA/DUF88 family protein
MANRVRVYIDGFNLYYRALRGTPHRWLNPVALAASLIDPDDIIDHARYFTARVSARAGDIDAPRRQQIYLSALATIPEMKIHYGRFMAKTKTRPLVAPPHNFVEVQDTEEKGSDVNLASHLLFDAWQGRMDTALVLSQDTDLLEPMRLLSQEIKMPIGLVWLDGKQPGKNHRNVVSFIRHATPARLSAAQFPDRLMGKNGHIIERPIGW